MNMITRIESETGDNKPGVSDRLRRMPLLQRGSLVALPVVLVAAGLSIASKDAPAAMAAPPPPVVTVSTPLVRDVNEWDDYRSEERRVGKECRWGGATDEEKKKV